MPLNNFTFLKNKTALALTAILLAAFALRVVGISYGLPQEFIGDEFVQVAVALKMLDEKSLLPYFPDVFYHQPLSAYVSTAGIGAYLAWQLASGRFEGIAEMRDFYAVHSTDLLLIVRFLSVLLGTAAVGLIYLAGRDLFGRRVGLLAAAFAAFDFLLVYINHSGRVWGYMVFFVALALWTGVRLLNADRWRDYFFSAGASFLAAANLLPGIITFVPQFVARFSFKNRRMWLAVAALAAGLVLIFLANPRGIGTLLARFGVDVPFLTKMVFPSAAVGSHPVLESTLARFYDPFLTLFHYSPLILIFAAAGLALLFREDRKKFWFFGSFLAAYYLFVGPFYSYGWVARALVPFVPYLALLSAYAVEKTAEKFFAGKKAAWVILAALVILPSAALSLRFDVLITRPDTRTQAIDWIYANLPEDSKIAVFSFTNEVVNQNREVMELVKEVAPKELNTRHKTLLASGDAAFPSPRYFAWDVRDIPPGVLPAGFFGKQGFRYYLRTSWGGNSQKYLDELEGQIAEKKLLARFSPFGTDDREPYPSVHNMPRPWGPLLKAERLGPLTEIYEVKFK